MYVAQKKKELHARTVKHFQGNDATKDFSCSLMIAQWQSLGFTPVKYPKSNILCLQITFKFSEL